MRSFTTRLLIVIFTLLVPTLVFAASSEDGGHGTDWTGLLFATINLSILIGLGIYLLRKPFTNYLKSWRGDIERDMKEAEEMKARADEKLKEYEAKLAEMENKRQEIIEEFRELGDREKQRIIENAKLEAERISRNAEFEIQQEIKRASAQLEKAVVEQAMTMATTEAKNQMNPAAQKQIVSQYFGLLKEEESLN